MQASGLSTASCLSVLRLQAGEHQVAALSSLKGPSTTIFERLAAMSSDFMQMICKPTGKEILPSIGSKVADITLGTPAQEKASLLGLEYAPRQLH